MSKVFLYIGLCLVLAQLAVGCSGQQQPFPEMDSPPARLYTDKCSLCHPAYHPQAHTSTGWTKVVSRMEKKAEDIGIKSFLSDEEKSIILAYLKKHASRGY